MDVHVAMSSVAAGFQAAARDVSVPVGPNSTDTYRGVVPTILKSYPNALVCYGKFAIAASQTSINCCHQVSLQLV